MTNFKRFLLESEEEQNVKETIAKLPVSHQKLLKGFKFTFEAGNTLKGDNDHIGYIHKNKIVVAAPWNYGREWTMLHEIGHKVYETLCTNHWKKEWSKIVKQNPKRQKQNNEELWCMAYANHFSKNKVDVHNHPAWDNYIKTFCTTA